MSKLPILFACLLTGCTTTNTLVDRWCRAADYNREYISTVINSSMHPHTIEIHCYGHKIDLCNPGGEGATRMINPECL